MDVISTKTLIYFFIPYRLFSKKKYPIHPKNPNVLIWVRFEDFQKIHENPQKSKHIDFKGFTQNPFIQKSLKKLRLLDIGLPKNFFCYKSLGKLHLLGSFATSSKTSLRYVFLELLRNKSFDNYDALQFIINESCYFLRFLLGFSFAICYFLGLIVSS